MNPSQSILSNSTERLDLAPLIGEEDEYKMKYSLWDLEELQMTTCSWIRTARKENIDVSKQIKKIAQVILQAPPIREERTGKIREVTLVQQVIVRGLYLNQILRKITKYRIIRTFDECLNNQRLSRKYNLIRRSKQWLLNRLPPKMNLDSHHLTLQDCQVLLAKMEEMKEKILT